MSYNIGDRIHIRAIREPGGTIMCERLSPGWADQPVHTVVVAQVRVCGIPDCYGVEWADTREPVGLPIFPSNIVDADGNLISQ